MLRPKFNVDSLTTSSDLVACIAPADELFTLVSRSATVPAGWVALLSRRSQDPVIVRGGEHCESQEAVDVLFVRDAAIECVVEESVLRSADGFDCRGTIRVPLRVVAEPADLTAFRRKVIGSGLTLSTAGLRDYLKWDLCGVLADLAAGRPAGQLLQPLDAGLIRNLVKDKLGAACLASGLAIETPVAVCFESPGWQEHRRQQASDDRARRQATARAEIQQALAAAERERLTHLTDMLERMRQTNTQQGNLSMVELLRAFDEAQRGEFYAALSQLYAGERTTRLVAVVSGGELLLFEPSSFNRPARRVRLPEDLGPLRSVRADGRSLQAGVLMVGAARGVHLVDLDTGEVRQSLMAEAPDARQVHGGFNAAAMSDDRVLATHSELGLLAWDRKAEPQAPPAALLADLTRGSQTVRCAQVADMAVWFAADHQLWCLPLEGGDTTQPIGYTGSRTSLSAVAVASGAVYAGDADGQVIAWQIGEPAFPRVLRGKTGNPIESIDVLQTGGVDRLIIADRGNALLAMVAGDNYCCRYESGAYLVRRAAADDDLLVAMNDRRDCLLIWNPRQPARPSATAIVPHLTGGTIQDLCLVPSAGGRHDEDHPAV